MSEFYILAMGHGETLYGIPPGTYRGFIHRRRYTQTAPFGSQVPVDFDRNRTWYIRPWWLVIPEDETPTEGDTRLIQTALHLSALWSEGLNAAMTTEDILAQIIAARQYRAPVMVRSHRRYILNPRQYTTSAILAATLNELRLPPWVLPLWRNNLQ